MDKEIRDCLICQQSFEIQTDDIPASIVNSKILFDSCMRILDIEEQSYNEEYKWKWDARFDLPNFCSPCAEDIALLSVFEEDLSIIKNKIKEGTAKTKTAILNSMSDENRNLHSVVPNLYSSGDVSASIKLQYYRSCAIRDWNPVVTLSRCDEKKKTEGQDDGIIDLSQTNEVVPLSREEGQTFLLDIGDKFQCKLCLTVFADNRNIGRHVDFVHRKIKRFQCKHCKRKYTNKLECRIHVNKTHRNAENITPLSLAKFYSKSNYLRNNADKDTKTTPPESPTTPFFKPLIMKCETTEENKTCLICQKYIEDGGVQISSEVFASLSQSLKVSQWDRRRKQPIDLLLCISCSSLTTDLHFSKLEFTDTKRIFDKLLLKFKTNLILSNRGNIFQQTENSQSISESISTAQKANYFRNLAVKEFNPVVRISKIENFVNDEPRKSTTWRTPNENSIFKLVKSEEIIILNPELVDRAVLLTDEEIGYYFQYDAGQYVCRICDSKFMTYYAANHHCNSKHKYIMRFQCKYCHKQYYQRSDCAYHVVASHKTERLEIAAEIEKSIIQSRSAKMTSADGVIRIAKEAMPPLPPASIIKVGNGFKCTICSTVYKNRGTIVAHQKIVHLKFNRYKCEFCPFKNHHRFPVVSHVRRIHRDKLMQNGTKQFPSNRMSKNRVTPSAAIGMKVLESNESTPNIDEHMTLADGQYLCKFCGRQFIYRYKIIDHLEGVHFGVRRFQCEVCSMKFYTFAHCKRHIARIHSNAEGLCSSEGGNINIEECQKLEGLETPNRGEKSEVSINVTQEAQDTEDPLCADMEYPGDEETLIEIPVLGELDIKVLPFTFNIEDPYLCETEDSASGSCHLSSAGNIPPEVKHPVFSSIPGIKEKKKSGKMERDPVYGLIQPGNIITLPKNPNYEEELKKGFKKTEKGYQCLKCDKISSKITIFRQHWGNIHDTSEGFECSICQKRFYFKFKCAQHYINKHTNLKPYTCNICERSFGNNTSLEYHVKLHFSERSFGCSACSMKFISDHTLKHHFKKQHMKILGT